MFIEIKFPTVCGGVRFKLLSTKREFWPLHCFLVTRKHSMPHADLGKTIPRGIQLSHLPPQPVHLASSVDKALLEAKVLCHAIHETDIFYGKQQPLLELAGYLRDFVEPQ